MATPTIASINPFPNDVRIAFQAYIQDPKYINRERIPYEKWHRIHVHLDNPTLKPENPVDSRLKHRAHTEFQLINNKLYRRPDSKFPNLRYTVPESEAFDIIANEHLQLLHAGYMKTWATIQQKYYGIKREEIEFILKRCKNCALNRPATTKAPLVPIVSRRAWERVQIDLIDMRHEPSGQFKWILHIKDHFSKYTQLYPLKSKHAEPIAEAFALFIAAFLPPKIMQADNGKEFKGALIILLRKYGIQIINGAPRSPQTQGLVEQANGVVESKLRAWKMDNGSTTWADGLLEVTLAMNTQKHSTIGCAPAELLFREHTSHSDWLNSQARKDLAIGVAQEDPTQAPIYDIPTDDLPIQSSPTEEWFDMDAYEQEPELQLQLQVEVQHQAQAGSRIDSRLRSESTSQLGIERGRRPGAGLNSGSTEPTSQLGIERGRRPGAGLKSGPTKPSQPTSQLRIEPESERESDSKSEGESEDGSEPQSEPGSTIIVQSIDPIIQRAQEATQKARIKMVKKYAKQHDIQHFSVNDIVSLKVPREDRTSTDNKRLFARILDEPYSHRYKVITLSGVIKRLIPTKGLGVIEQALWLDIIIPDSTREVTLGQAARDASTSARVGVSCQCKGLCDTKRCRCHKEGKQCSVHCHRDDHNCGNLSGLAIRTEIALVERPRRKRARANTEGNAV
jgi:hypothetical protein